MAQEVADICGSLLPLQPLAASGGLWRPLAASGGLWRPMAAMVSKGLIFEVYVLLV